MGGAKQFPATRKRLEKARSEGDVAKSPELSIGFSGLVCALYVLFSAPDDFEQLVALFDASLGAGRDFHSKDMLVSLREALLFGGSRLFRLLAVAWLSTFAAEAAQVGLKFSWEVLLWKWSRVSFLSGFKRICGWQEGSEGSLPLGLLKAAGKSFALICGVGLAGAFGWYSFTRRLHGAEARSEHELMLALSEAFVIITLPMAGVTLLIGAADLMLARAARGRRLRMDLQELRQELRESEGDPETRSMRKQLHQEFLLHGMLEGIRRAKVVVLGRREEK